jgi:hypothetical protein
VNFSVQGVHGIGVRKPVREIQCIAFEKEKWALGMLRNRKRHELLATNCPIVWLIFWKLRFVRNVAQIVKREIHVLYIFSDKALRD